MISGAMILIKKKYQKIDSSQIIPRESHTAVTSSDNMYVYGGYNFREGNLDDFYEFNFQTKKWSLINKNSTNIARCGHTSVIYNQCMYLFGGCFENNYVSQF